MVTGVYPTTHNPHSGTFIKTLVDSLVEAGVEVEVIHPRPGPTILRYISAAAQVFCKTFSRRFDIIHGHYGQWCLLARLQWTTPVIASFLGSDLLGDVNFAGQLTRKGRLVTWASLWLCKHVAATTVKSEEMRNIAGDEAIVYSDGINFEVFRPIPRAEARMALGWEQDRYYILFGNNPRLPVKNFALAQAAIQRLSARGTTAELVVASGLPQATLVQYINASDALILSSYSEGSPNIVKEAMACNIPVVSTNVGDVSQVLGDTSACSVWPPDPDALADGLTRALQQTEPTGGRVAVAFAEQSVVAQQVLTLYGKVARKAQQILAS